MNDLETQLAEILSNRFMELFQTALKKPLRPALYTPDQVPFTSPVFHAEIGLTGDGIDGRLVLTTDKKFLHETHPERRYGGFLDDADYLDWASEICNRVLAGSKAHIQALGFHLRLQQPMSRQALPAAASAGTNELVQALESEGFHAVLSLRISKMEARISRAS